IPQEIGDFGILLHAGYSKAKALWMNFLSALASVVGVVLALVFSGVSESFAPWLLPIAAGGFIYIAMSDLVPEMHKTKNVKYATIQLVTVALGVAAMALLLLLEA